MRTMIMLILFAFSGGNLLAQTTQTDQPSAKEHNRLYAELGLSFSHFEQQAKQEIGGVKGTLLSDETTLSLALGSGYRIFDFLSLGMYMRCDSGKRRNGRFDGFDASGMAIVANNIGGEFSELWLGPFVKLHWKQLFLSVGHGIYGTRRDQGRIDITSTLISSIVDDQFDLDPSVAWIFHLGGDVDISQHIDIYFGLEYRARYYKQKTNNTTMDNIVLGTQNITPLIGLRYNI